MRKGGFILWLAICLVGWLASLPAQDSFCSQPGERATLFLSGADMPDLQTLTGGQLQAFVNILAATPTISPNVLPAGGQAGNFYSLQHPNWPPLPGDINGQSVWKMTGGGWLLDDFDFDYQGGFHRHAKVQAKDIWSGWV
jgi:hypothetical protein